MQSASTTALALAAILGTLPNSARADAPPGDCTMGDECYRTSRAMLRCNNYGYKSPQLIECVCDLDPTWDRDILECTMCWAREPGTAYQESTLVKDSLYVSCGPSPVPACDDSFCRPAWQVINTCGGYSAAQKDCICNYYYAWQASVESIGNCTGCLYGKGETALADSLRGWYDWRCELTNGYIPPVPTNPSSPRPSASLNVAGGLAVPGLASLLLLSVVEAACLGVA